MRLQTPALLALVSIAGLGIGVGVLTSSSHAEDPVFYDGDPGTDPKFPLQPYKVVPDLEGQVAYGQVDPDHVLEQPIAYSHKLHAGELGIDCQYCHAGARRTIHAGVPETQTCMNCHTNIKSKGRPELEKLADYWERGEPIPWKKVHDLPDFVYFSHKRHVRGGVACQECHGEIQDEMTVAKRVNTLEMGWCLDCHRDHPKVDENYGANAQLRRAELKDCLTCHK